jgi:hypothetical protein
MEGHSHHEAIVTHPFTQKNSLDELKVASEFKINSQESIGSLMQPAQTSSISSPSQPKKQKLIHNPRMVSKILHHDFTPVETSRRASINR